MITGLPIVVSPYLGSQFEVVRTRWPRSKRRRIRRKWDKRWRDDPRFYRLIEVEGPNIVLWTDPHTGAQSLHVSLRIFTEVMALGLDLRKEVESIAEAFTHTRSRSIR